MKKQITLTTKKSTALLLISSILALPCLNINAANAANAAKNSSNKEIRIPIEAELKRYILAAESFYDNNSLSHANSYLDRAKGLQVELPADYFYLRGKVLSKQQQWSEARMNFEEYILRSKDDDDHYIESLEMITQIENIAPDALDEKLVKKEIEWESDAQPIQSDTYLEKIKELYLEKSAKDALVQHINVLLASTPFTGKNLVSGASEDSLKTSISITEGHKLSVQKTQQKDGKAQVTAFNMSVFGLSREFITQCDTNLLKCTIKHKDTLNTWFEIGYEEALAQEIAEATSALVLTMQTESEPQ